MNTLIISPHAKNLCQTQYDLYGDAPDLTIFYNLLQPIYIEDPSLLNLIEKTGLPEHPDLKKGDMIAVLERTLPNMTVGHVSSVLDFTLDPGNKTVAPGMDLQITTLTEKYPFPEIWTTLIEKNNLNIRFSYCTVNQAKHIYEIYDPDEKLSFRNAEYYVYTNVPSLKNYDICSENTALSVLNDFFHTEHTDIAELKKLCDIYNNDIDEDDEPQFIDIFPIEHINMICEEY